MQRADAQLDQLRPPPAKTILTAPQAYFAALEHALSDNYRMLNPRKRTQLRSPVEHMVLARHFGALRGQAPFVPTLIGIASEATSSEATVRTGPQWLGGDCLGNRIQLPDSDMIAQQLDKCDKLVRETASVSPLFAAIVTLALLVNCHPFIDGNGRVGRILFNACLRIGGLGVDEYIPFYEAAERSRGGYEISLRTAEIRGEWEPLFDWGASLIELCAGW
ncbi:Fic family protein [Sphingomonas sp. DT-207]|uniref:Fic family protein n=1 Tax=Sphingomonas sp. DT-207 TaxID=3396167 RepID=UPI003F1BF042